MDGRIAQQIFKWLWVILQPSIEQLLRDLADKGAERVRELSRRLDTRAEVTRDLSKRADILAREAEVADPIEAAYQRGRKEAYAEMAMAYGIDAEALKASAEELREEMIATGGRRTEQIQRASKKRVEALPDET